MEQLTTVESEELKLGGRQTGSELLRGARVSAAAAEGRKTREGSRWPLCRMTADPALLTSICQQSQQIVAPCRKLLADCPCLFALFHCLCCRFDVSSCVSAFSVLFALWTDAELSAPKSADSTHCLLYPKHHI